MNELLSLSDLGREIDKVCEEEIDLDSLVCDCDLVLPW